MPSKQGPRLWLRLTNIQHPQCRLPELLTAHPINHAVQLVVPLSSDQTVEEAGPTLQNDSCLATGPLGDVVDDLVQYARRQHEASSSSAPLLPIAVALGPQLDSTGGICMTDDGRLHLTVTASTYKRLGLVGKHSSVAEGEQYSIDIDMTSKGMQPGKPYHERVVSRLNQVLGGTCLSVAMPAQVLQASAQSTATDAQAAASMHIDTPSATEHDQPVQASSQSAAMAVQASSAFAAVFQNESCTLRGLPLQQRAWMVHGVTIPDLSRPSIALVLQPASIAQQQARIAAVTAGQQGDRQSAPTQGNTQPPYITLHNDAEDRMDVDVSDGTQQPAVQGLAQDTGQAACSSSSGSSASMAHELLQWLGAVSCGCPGQVLEQLRPPSLATTPASTHTHAAARQQQELADGKLRVIEWRGIIHSTAVRRLVEDAAWQVSSGRFKWAAIGVWGWEDSPVSWAGMQHHSSCGLAGDTTSHYWLVLLPNQDMLVLRALGSADVAC